MTEQGQELAGPAVGDFPFHQELAAFLEPQAGIDQAPDQTTAGGILNALSGRLPVFGDERAQSGLDGRI